MEEIATCKCGNQAWSIYGDRVECTKCGNVIKLTCDDLMDDIMFYINQKRKETL